MAPPSRARAAQRALVAALTLVAAASIVAALLGARDALVDLGLLLACALVCVWARDALRRTPRAARRRPRPELAPGQPGFDLERDQSHKVQKYLM